MVYPNAFEQKIGFTSIRSMLAGECITTLGERLVEKMSFSDKPDEIRSRVALTDELRHIMMMESTFPALEYHDLASQLKYIAVKGTYIPLEAVTALRQSLATIASVLKFLASKELDEYPCLRKIAEGKQAFTHIVSHIDAVIDPNGNVKDNATPALAAIRREIMEKSNSVSKLMQKVLKQAQSEGWADADSSAAVRDGRTVIPVTSAYKRKIQGIVHDESATGKTSYIEPAEVVESNNRIRELEIEEQREIIRILISLADIIRPELPGINDGFRLLGQLDFVRAKAVLAGRMNAVCPLFSANPYSMNWIKARHPLMYMNFIRESRELVAQDIRIDSDNRIILISGPNAGGKSVCLKTVGLIQYMFQCGLLVPVSENSEMAVFTDIFMDMGDEQSIENDLSTYSSHLMNMKYFLRNSGPGTLVLIDEFGTGTEPSLGGSIAEAVLDHLNRRKVCGVITTHYTNLKHFALSAEGIVNGAMQYDSQRMMPLFKLEIGMPGSSFAFEIARKIGLPEEVLSEASQIIGKDNIDFDRHLREIIRDKHYWETKREKIRISEKKLEEEIARHSQELSQIDKERKEILRNARSEASDILSGVNRQIENTIRQIRESQAEKEKTKNLRKDLEQLRQSVEQPDDQNQSQIQAKMDRIKARQERLRKKRQEKSSEPQSKPEAEPVIDNTPLKVSDKVRMEGQQMAGEVVSLSGKNASVAFGDMLINVPVKKLKKISTKEYKQCMQELRTTSSRITVRTDSYRERSLQFHEQLDVRGERTEDAINKVRQHIDDALMLGYSQVRILHGKGNGILRQMIREYLKASGLVQYFRDESEEHGGAGITVVTL